MKKSKQYKVICWDIYLVYLLLSYKKGKYKTRLSITWVANAGYHWPIGATYLETSRCNSEISPLKLLQNMILNADRISASSSALMDQDTYLDDPSTCFLPNIWKPYIIECDKDSFDATSRTQWNSFPCWKKLPQDGICRRPFEHLLSKETETVFQFSSNSSHQKYDIAWINNSFCFMKIEFRKLPALEWT